MASVNKVVLVGNLGRDPECRNFPNGDQIANVTIATTDKWKDKTSGELREVTEWHRIVFNGRLAEVVGQYLRKGSQIYVEGSLRTRKWTDKDGVEKYTTEIRANEMQMLGSKPSGGRDDDDYSAPRQAPAQRPVAQRPAASQHSTPARQPAMAGGGGGGSGGGGGGGFSAYDDDIPFAMPPESRFPV